MIAPGYTELEDVLPSVGDMTREISCHFYCDFTRSSGIILWKEEPWNLEKGEPDNKELSVCV